MFMTFMLIVTDMDHKDICSMFMTFMLIVTDRDHKDICSHVHDLYVNVDWQGPQGYLFTCS